MHSRNGGHTIGNPASAATRASSERTYGHPGGD